MNEPLRRGIRLTLLLALFLALISANTSAGVGQASQAGKENAGLNANASGRSIESVKLAGLYQSGDPPGVDPELIKKLKQNARGPVTISTNKSTTFASFVRAGKDGDLLPGQRSNSPQGKAYGFFAEYGGLFGIRNASTELIPIASHTDNQGATHISFQQVYKDVPVFAAILQAHLNVNNELTAMNGVFIPDIELNTAPILSGEEAAQRAVAEVLANPPQNELTGASLDISADELSTSASTLYVYKDGLIQNVEGPNYLTYEVEVTNGSSVREMVYINAHSGKIINRISQVHDALFRRLFETSTSTQVWQEGDPFPGSLNQDQQNIVNFSGDSYYHFFNAFNRDSYDGAGHEMQSVNNDPRISCPNANWNGLTTNYCNGVTADDVVAHEWGHAYTEYTHGLIYQWQSGALNESYSDIWGEVVDMLNGKGTDSPAPLRTVDACSTSTRLPGLLRIHSPASIAGDYQAQAASFGPALTVPGVTGPAVLAEDGVGSSIPGDPALSIYDACEPLTNGDAVNGKIALTYRGTCNFTVKVKNAQNAGATGVIVANRNNAGGLPGMGGGDPTIVIPSLGITYADGELIRANLASPVTAELTIDADVSPENTVRWLMGEDSTAFGGAIRDMWSPGCYSDPAKVTDPLYHCTSDDGGGVHSNSGVPNHGFSLLVDGGTYNGQTVNSIGMTKAAHLYWRAQAVYQTLTTNFNAHADALQASCQDLIGVSLEGLSASSTPAGPSGQAITAADCAAVDAMIEAVELRVDPAAQCNFQPILQKNPPPLCSNQKNPSVIYLEDFEDGLAGWTLTNQGVYSGWPGLDWTQATTLPGSRSGSAAFAADPNGGDCGGGDGDISGMMSLESPIIHIPNTKTLTTRLSFEHYAATEAGWDGGNLKISINGGPYSIVPSSAYTFNPYNTTLQTAQAGNTNPLAGQPAFSGTDGGSLFGSWGQSQIDLAKLGVKLGDNIQLRYNFGMDGCTGNDGWYVDNVTISACNTKK